MKPISMRATSDDTKTQLVSSLGYIFKYNNKSLLEEAEVRTKLANTRTKTYLLYDESTNSVVACIYSPDTNEPIAGVQLYLLQKPMQIDINKIKGSSLAFQHLVILSFSR